MKCQNCNREMNPKDEFCGGCGSKSIGLPTSETDSCPSCRNEMSADQTHCQKCGNSRNVFESETLKQRSASSSKSSRLPGIIFAAIGTVIVLYAIWNFQTTGETLRTDNNPGIGLQHVVSVPIGIVGLIILIAGLFFLGESSEKA